MDIKYRQPYYRQGKLKDWHYWGVTGKGEFTNPMSLVDTKGEQGQQFTGKTDKNGVEIFEGDIISCKMSSKGIVRRCTGEIVYFDKFCAFSTKHQGDVTLFHNHILSTLEIIGNIYESPELLNE